jgi:hypothetical protein
LLSLVTALPVLAGEVLRRGEEAAVMDRVIIGVDPHKRSVTFEARDTREVLRLVGTLPMTTDGYRALRQVGRQWPDRFWAIEGANGTGRPVAQRLLADGERVLGVPAKLAARNAEAASFMVVIVHLPRTAEPFAGTSRSRRRAG